MFSNDDTIAAIATPPGAGGIGVIRISGAKAPHILARLFHRRQDEKPWQSHHLYIGQIIEPRSGLVLDEALAVLMQAPHSYTREQVAELHCHGGPLLLSHILTACVAAGARLAERGEFTLRAFLNGALSLDEAEAVADLISAKTAQAAQLAARQLQGGLNQRLAPLEEELLTILAQLSAGVDFPEEVDALAIQDILPRLINLRREIAHILAGAASGRIYREGYKTVLAGATNVGKSSLLNRLLQMERAIVTEEAGATRDLLEEALNLDGLPILLSDTAGLRETTAVLTEAETQGIKRSRAALDEAQLILIVTDITQGVDPIAQALLADMTPRETEHNPALPQARQHCCLLLNKTDLLSPPELKARLSEGARHYPNHVILGVSAQTGAGIEELLQYIKNTAMGGWAAEEQTPLLNNLRHQQALLRADTALSEAITTLNSAFLPDLAIIDLENAYQALGEISGKTVSEEVLARIFADFCVGK